MNEDLAVAVEEEQSTVTNIFQRMYEKQAREIEHGLLTALWCRFNGVDVLHYRTDDYEFKMKMLPWIHEPSRGAFNDPEVHHVDRYDFREGIESDQ